MSEPTDEILLRFSEKEEKEGNEEITHKIALMTMSKSMVLYIVKELPCNRERAFAIKKIEEAQFWARACVERGPR